MTPYDNAIIASSTAIVGDGGHFLYSSIWGFMPILLTIAIPLGLLIGGWRYVRGRAKVH